MTEDARLRAVEQGLAVHLAECGMRQREILEKLESMEASSRGRDQKLSSIQKGVWSAFTIILGLTAGSVWPAWFTAVRHILGAI